MYLWATARGDTKEKGAMMTETVGEDGLTRSKRRMYEMWEEEETRKGTMLRRIAKLEARAHNEDNAVQVLMARVGELTERLTTAEEGIAWLEREKKKREGTL